MRLINQVIIYSKININRSLN